MSRSVVLVLGRVAPNPDQISEAVRTVEAEGATVTVVTHDAVDLAGVPVLVVGRGTRPRRLKGHRVKRLLLQGVRTLLRRTPRAQLAKLVLAHGGVRDVVRSADVLVAGDSHSIEAVWRLARREPGPAAVNGVPAAVRALRLSAARGR